MTELPSLLTGNYACVGLPSNLQQDEEHVAGGTLIEYAKGPTDQIDPSRRVGSWSISGATNTVTYMYSGGPTFSYTVYPTTTTQGRTAPGSFCFVQSGTLLTYLVTVSTTPCLAPLTT